MDQFATHLPLLAWAVQHTKGPVLEFGAGEYSTPLLDVLTEGRAVITLESDAIWAGRIGALVRNPRHVVIHVEDWGACPLPEAVPDRWERWSVVLIDHAPSKRRKIDLERMRNLADLIVVHDTEPKTPYDFQDILATFPYRHDDKRWHTQTSVVSMTEHAICPSL